MIFDCFSVTKLERMDPLLKLTMQPRYNEHANE